jgi:hypothetical protein
VSSTRLSRPHAYGVYRRWRDAGYAVGALLAGILAGLLGPGRAIAGVGALTFASGPWPSRAWMRDPRRRACVALRSVALARMDERLPGRRPGAPGAAADRAMARPRGAPAQRP